MNLRLRADAEVALRAEAERTGRSQQELIREAVDRFLEPSPAAVSPESATASLGLDGLVARGLVRAPRGVVRSPARRLTLPEGVTSLGLLEREDRL